MAPARPPSSIWSRACCSADSGRVFFLGRDITGLKPHEISRLGIKRTLQIKSVFNQLSVAENLWVTRQAGSRFLHPFRDASRDLETKARVDQTLEQIGMTALAHRPAGTLSYGDVALLEIGMALISEPRLLLLDEPTCGMSPAETERAVAKIRELARTIDIVIIEHDMEVVFGMADDITVMAQGDRSRLRQPEGNRRRRAGARGLSRPPGRRGLCRGGSACLASRTFTFISASCISCRASTWR